MSFFRSRQIVILCCFASGCLLANEPAVRAVDAASDDDATARYRKADTDGDGRISRAEFQASVREKKNWWAAGERSANTEQNSPTPEQFTALDRDRDGYLTKAELEAGRRLRESRGDDGSGASTTRQKHLPGSPNSGSRGKTRIEEQQ